jgi:cytoskeletal protein RodZ
MTVGCLLTEARQQRGISLLAASSDLKISVRHLRALEEGDLSLFPAEIYAKGAFTKYAQYLGVYANTTQHAFQRVLTGAREYVPLRVHTPKPWLQSIITGHLVLAAVLVGVALIVGSYMAWQVATFVRLPELSLTTPIAGVSEASSVTINGKAAKDAEVMVNGSQVLLNNQGSFTTSLNLHPGINVLRLQAKNAADRVKVITRYILVPKH